MKLSKYQEVAKRILAIQEDKYTIDMSDFCSVKKDVTLEHPCGTTYCLAGILAHEDEYPDKYRVNDEALGTLFDYSGYSFDILGVNSLNAKWSYLFGTYHPNTLSGAKERAAYVLENDSCPLAAT